MPRTIFMNFNNSQSSYNIANRSNKPNISSSSIQRVSMNLKSSMIDRIKNAPAGCGSCGK